MAPIPAKALRQRRFLAQLQPLLQPPEDAPLVSASPPRSPLTWLSDQPYLLLCLTSLFWAGNAIVGRNAAGHIPPVTLSFVRWSLAFLIVLPFAWRHLAN